MHNGLLRRKRQHDSNPLTAIGIVYIKPDCPDNLWVPGQSVQIMDNTITAAQNKYDLSSNQMVGVMLNE